MTTTKTEGQKKQIIILRRNQWYEAIGSPQEMEVIF